jgi:hypothetical protein
MRKYLSFTLLASLAMLWGCSSTVLVPVPPRMDLKGYGTLGLVEFASNSGRAIDAHATQQFQERVQAAQPGTRFVELGSRETVLAAVNSSQIDREALKKIGEKYGVDAIFLGSIAYADPKADIKFNDLAKFEGGVRAEIRGDIFCKLVETRTGASVWSNSAVARRPLGEINVSEYGVTGTVGKSNPRDEMVPALVYHLTHDFRPSSVRQPAR